MKFFSERNPFVVGGIGVALTVMVVLGALNYQRLPFINQTTGYSAYFADASGLLPNAPVLVSGYEVGNVDSIALDGPRVVIKFHMADSIYLGDRTEAAIKTKTLLGAKFLEVVSRGDRPLASPIPLERTMSAYQLPDAVGDLTAAISGLDTDQLSSSLATLSETFKDTPAVLKDAVDGVGRFSDTLAARDAQLRNLLANAQKSTAVLAERSDQVVALIRDSNAVLAQLVAQQAALDQISAHISAAAAQLKGLVADNRQTFKPALDKLNGALSLVDNRKTNIQQVIKGINKYAMSLGEALSSGPFFNAYVANLLPGQFVQPFIDAAFSDLGLDPATKLPTELTDPPVGQPGTPALPVPFPRTGQGGDPRLTVPDAITGNPGDQQCGPPGLPLPGPGCYPHRPAPPAPAPGGPPPGPPGPAPPGLASMPSPTPAPVYLPAPGEVAPPPAAP